MKASFSEGSSEVGMKFASGDRELLQGDDNISITCPVATLPECHSILCALCEFWVPLATRNYSLNKNLR
jgi:hypothetical protein